jgi:hypothetical protein
LDILAQNGLTADEAYNTPIEQLPSAVRAASDATVGAFQSLANMYDQGMASKTEMTLGVNALARAFPDLGFSAAMPTGAKTTRLVRLARARF